MATQNDNSGTGVILGILVAVLIAIGGYYFLRSEGDLDVAGETTNIEMPDVNVAPAAGDQAEEQPAEQPAAQ